jgi:hypothetical protein
VRAYLVTAYAGGLPQTTVRAVGMRAARKLAQWFNGQGLAARIYRDRLTNRKGR